MLRQGIGSVSRALPGRPLRNWEETQIADGRRRAALRVVADRERRNGFERWDQANDISAIDDGIIDPRDTRTVLGFCLSVIHNGEVRGQRGYGVFRM